MNDVSFLSGSTYLSTMTDRCKSSVLIATFSIYIKLKVWLPIQYRQYSLSCFFFILYYTKYDKCVVFLLHFIEPEIINYSLSEDWKTLSTFFEELCLTKETGFTISCNFPVIKLEDAIKSSWVKNIKEMRGKILKFDCLDLFI